MLISVRLPVSIKLDKLLCLIQDNFCTTEVAALFCVQVIPAPKCSLKVMLYNEECRE